MRSAEEILKEFEKEFEKVHFTRGEILEMMNVYAKEVFDDSRKKDNRGVFENWYDGKFVYENFEDLLKEKKESPKRIISDIDPYGEENWDEKDNSECGTSFKDSSKKRVAKIPDTWYFETGTKEYQYF